MDWIKSLISGEAGNAAQVISIIVIANGVLSGIRVALDAVKDKTDSKIDNKIAKYLGIGLGYSSKLIDFLQGNVSHKK